MKRIFLVFLLTILFSFNCLAVDLEEEIKNKAGIDKIEEIVPESVKNNESLQELEFSYFGARDSVGINFVTQKFLSLFSLGIKAEISFICASLSFVVIISLLKAFCEGAKLSGFKECVEFALSVFLCVFLYSHVLKSLETVVLYISELSTFIRALLPFFITLVTFQGGTAEAVGSGAVVISVVAILETLCQKVVLPLVKILFAFICAGVVSGMNFSAITDFISSFASKTCSIGMSIFCAVMFFQHSLCASADSLALRSVKLAASNFIPIIGGNMSEAAATLISGVKLVKSSLGIFAFAVLLYLTAVPIISFIIKKISLRFISGFASLLGCDAQARFLKSLSGVYNLLSALMFSSASFFIVAVALFVKSGGL